MVDVTQRLTNIIKARGRVPKMKTGIFGENGQL